MLLRLERDGHDAMVSEGFARRYDLAGAEDGGPGEDADGGVADECAGDVGQRGQICVKEDSE